MAKPSLATVRTHIQARLRVAYADTGWKAYGKAYGGEIMPAFIVIPVPNETGTWYLAQAGDGGDDSCPLVYQFLIEIWAPTVGGVDKAQDMMDEIISPAGTTALSLEAVLENVGGTYDNDALDVVAKSIKADQFTSYGFGALNANENDSIVARVPLEVYV